jgi:hypothetical protein
MRFQIVIKPADRCRSNLHLPCLDLQFVAKPSRAKAPPLAAFVAQLVATFLRLPQTRALRRGSQEDVIFNYTNALNSIASIHPKQPLLDRSV